MPDDYKQKVTISKHSKAGDITQIMRFGLPALVVISIVAIAVALVSGYDLKTLLNNDGNTDSVSPTINPITAIGINDIQILVADFDGPSTEVYRVTETIINRLREATSKYPAVEVVALNRTISESEGADVAQAVGRNHNADIVIWGWYGVTDEAVPLGLHFEVMDSWWYDKSGLSCSSSESQVRSTPVTEIENFSLQTNLSDELIYASVVSIGLAHHSKGDWNAAISSYTDALINYPESFPTTESDLQNQILLDHDVIYLLRANAYFVQGDIEPALQDLNKLIETESSNPDVFRNRGYIHLKQGNIEAAILDYEKSLSLEPDSAISTYFLANAEEMAGDIEQALDDYHEALSIGANEVIEQVLFLGGTEASLIPYSKRNDENNLRDFSDRISLNPENFFAYFVRSELYQLKNDIDAAIADLDKVIEYRPEASYAYYSLAHIYFDQDNDISLKNLDKAIELGLNSPEAYYWRGIVNSEEGNSQQALDDYSKAIKLLPGHNSCFYNNRGLVQKELGNLDAALSDFDTSVGIDSNFAKGYLNRYSINLKKGKLIKAFSDLVMYIKLDPEAYKDSLIATFKQRWYLFLAMMLIFFGEDILDYFRKRIKS